MLSNTTFQVLKQDCVRSAFLMCDTNKRVPYIINPAVNSNGNEHV